MAKSSHFAGKEASSFDHWTLQHWRTVSLFLDGSRNAGILVILFLTHSLTHSLSRSLSNSDAQFHKHTNAHTRSYTLTLTLSFSHSQMLTHTCTSALSLTLACTQTHTHALGRTRTHYCCVLLSSQSWFFSHFIAFSPSTFLWITKTFNNILMKHFGLFIRKLIIYF